MPGEISRSSEGPGGPEWDEVRRAMAEWVRGESPPDEKGPCVPLVSEEAGELRRQLTAFHSEVADVCRRIGPAASPDWVRKELEDILGQWAFWLSAKCYLLTEDDALAYLRREAAISPGLSFPATAYKQVARMMLALRNANWSARPCLVCGAVSVGLYRGRVEFPTCGRPTCELKMQGGIDAADGSNR